jgi:hypothetical protein
MLINARWDQLPGLCPAAGAQHLHLDPVALPPGVVSSFMAQVNDVISLC